MLTHKALDLYTTPTRLQLTHASSSAYRKLHAFTRSCIHIYVNSTFNLLKWGYLLTTINHSIKLKSLG